MQLGEVNPGVLSLVVEESLGLLLQLDEAHVGLHLLLHHSGSVLLVSPRHGLEHSVHLLIVDVVGATGGDGVLDLVHLEVVLAGDGVEGPAVLVPVQSFLALRL